MKDHLISFLTKPYPFIENGIHKVIISAIFSVVIFFFLFWFKPTFGHDEMIHLPLFFLGWIALISFFCFIFNLLILPKLFKKWFNPLSWNIKKTILFSFFFIFLISISNYLFLTLNKFPFIQSLNFLSVIATTALTGFVPSILLIMYVEKYQQYKKNIDTQRNDNRLLYSGDKEREPQITFFAKSRLDYIEICKDQFLFIKSEGNYVKIFYQDDNVVKTKLIRNSLNSIEIDFSNHSNIKRVHRSYLVNMESKLKVEGNSRNRYIRFEKYNFTIPISRSLFKMENDQFKN